MTPGFAKTRAELPWLYYPENDRVIINAHNFVSGSTFNPIDTYGIFDGTDDYVTGISLSNPKSASIWVKHTGSFLNFKRAFSLNTNTFSLYFGASGSVTARYNGATLTVAAAMSLNIWYHFVLQFDPADNKLHLFRDGVEIGTAVSTTAISGSNSMNIGASTSVTQYMLGNIADFRVYSDTLTTGEIDWLFSGGVSGSDPTTANLLARYKFDEGSGYTVGDSSGNGHNGTATNITPASFWGT